MVEVVLQIIIPITMFGLMFGMGLTLTKADFKRVLSFPKPTFIALVLQLLVLPIVGFALAGAFGLSTMMAVGLVAVAACPGGTTSNIVVHMGKGDTALSITITATATIVTLFTLPLWTKLALDHFGGSDNVVIDMPVLQTAFQIALFTVFPVALGMVLRVKVPALIAREPMISKLSTAAMLIAFIGSGFADSNDLLSKAMVMIVPALLFVVCAMCIGYGVPRVLGVNQKDSATIAVETCLKNILLSMFLATTALNDMEAALASVVVGVVMMPLAVGIMVLYRLSTKSSV
jgi:BASS family bile acid:Na+ symporter